MLLETNIKLVEKAVNGQKEAVSEIYSTIKKDVRYTRNVRRLSYKQYALESDDVVAEFWRGVMIGMQSVSPYIGDPISFLVHRGVWQVKSAIRSEINRTVVQECALCGNTNGTYKYDRKCNKCGELTINMHRQSIINESTAEYLEEIGSLDLKDVFQVLSSKQQEILHVLVEACQQNVANPSAEVARKLKLSRQRIHQQIKRIKEILTKKELRHYI